MKIAFATQDLKRVDAHFGWAKNIAIYEVSPQGSLVEAIQFEGICRKTQRRQTGAEDRGHQDNAILTWRRSAIGRSAWSPINPSDQVNQPEDIGEILDKLQVLQGTPPLGCAR